MKILVSYRGIPPSPGWATGDMVVKAFQELGHEVYPYAKYYQENRWVEGRPGLDEHVWDLILFLECNDGDPQYPELRITKARKTACWLFDTSYYQDRCQFLVNYFKFDHKFLANPLTVQQYKTWGYNNVHYLPYACDRDLHGRDLGGAKSHDVVLVGSIRDDRRALAHELDRLGVNLKLIGGVFREDYIDALASAKIVINQNPDAGRGLLNMRYWESPAAGSFVLTENSDYAVQPVNILNGGTYNNTQDIAEFCVAALGNLETLTQATKMSQEHVFQHHTYKNRCEEILKECFPYETN